MQKAERIVSEKLEIIIGVTPKVQNGVVKVTTKELSGRQMRELSDIAFRDDVEEATVKRSGAGLTVLIKVDNSYWD